MKKRTLLTGCLLSTVTGIAQADTITAINVSYVGNAPEVGGINLDNEDNVVNGNGLSAIPAADGSDLDTITHAGASFSAPGNAWATTDPGGFPSDFFDSNPGTVVFEFDLGGTYLVDSIAVWGYHFNDGFNGNSISNITLDFSTDGGTTTDSSQTVDIDLPTAFNLATIVGLVPANADYITMTVNDNHFGNPIVTGAGGVGGGDRVGLSEIAFTGALVPEPASAAMTLIGFGALAARRRRR